MEIISSNLNLINWDIFLFIFIMNEWINEQMMHLTKILQ